MATSNLKGLIGKLNETCLRALNDGAAHCLSRTNYNVEIEHWLWALLKLPGTDLAALLRYFEVDVARLSNDITRVLDRLKTGSARTPAFSANIIHCASEALLRASLDNYPKTRSAFVLLALLEDEDLARFALETSDEFRKVSLESLRKDMYDVINDTAEAREFSASPAVSGGGGAVPPPTESSARGAPSKTPALDQFTVDLTARARNGEIDPVLGRDAEIRLVIDILTRRRQNNPILTGEAGVGKTAVVEGFAQRVVNGDLPPSLRGVSVRVLDMGLLQAGAGIKGEFENRLKGVIQEVKSSPQKIILFIDEAHTMIGAGGGAGQSDAANLLKPALARGELRTIAATTWAEYKEYFEKDAALTRRFQVVKVEEPSDASAIEMMRGLLATLEKHHGVKVLDEALVDAVRLSRRYIAGRQLPDKAVSLLDTACARVGMSFNATPPAVEDLQRRIEQLGVVTDILRRESASGANHDERQAELAEATDKAKKDLAEIDKRWKQELDLATQIRRIRQSLETGFTDPPVATASESTAANSSKTPADPIPLSREDREKARAELAGLVVRLSEIQGENPLVQVCVDSQAVAEVVSAWTGIPVGRMVADEIKTVLNLSEKLESRIVGQSYALEAIAQAIRTSRANMTDPRKPIGVFLLVGTSGVGKTETAIALTELLYGGDQNMTIINMSEFKEEHKVSLLMGAPPGYVGYGKGGVLTEAVRRKPYSVILLDEMEKAHPGVQDIFYQVFDKGMLRDGEGRDIDFKNTVILMTSNAGTEKIMQLWKDPETRPNAVTLGVELQPELLKTFKPAFLGRVTLVPYLPLADDVMRKIIELQLGRVSRRIRENYKASFTYTPAVLNSIADRCKEVHTGARNVDHILTRTLLPELSSEFLARMADGQTIKNVNVDVKPDGAFRYEIA